ncbi:unnamed protein product [Adineta ricciae]|uniref:Carrier domain-containing protein n=2 Tax=Adineta ricciae TaxID=249248 RepID=A0A815WYU8_ADIRI|nr:unnamed protein product [Adineta ricciae]
MFIFNEQTFYRTGDFAKLNVQTKQLEFKGRRDHQVKLRGQRIDLGEIESVILAAAPIVQNCVVMKQELEEEHGNEVFLVAYLMVHQNSVNDKNKLCEQITLYCQQYLPSYMVPSNWLLLDSFPTNKNGKVDRKRLPHVECSSHEPNINQPTTFLERQLREIFSKAFNLDLDVIDVTCSFGQLGGTSFGVIRALSLIQQKVCKNTDVNLLLANPSIRQLATALEFLLLQHDDKSPEIAKYYDSSPYPQPSLIIETTGVLLLMSLWIFPVWIAYKSMLPMVFAILFIASFHLTSYIVSARILNPLVKKKREYLFSCSYYAWWFLNRLWTLNSTCWLYSLAGTSFYNAYLRACGAHIGSNVHIYTAFIDVPWLIEIDDETFIGEEVYFNNASYQSKTFELHPIIIGTSCVIGPRSVLYEDTQVQDGSFVESYSAVRGTFVGSAVRHTSCSYWSPWVPMFQLLSFLAVTTFYAVSFRLTYTLYIPMLPSVFATALCFIIWILSSAMIALLALKFVAGNIQPGSYDFQSWTYLRCLWLRRLIISFFNYPLSQVMGGYQRFSLVLLSWLGANVQGTNIEIADVIPFLRFPSHLLSIAEDVTSFGGVHLVPFDVDTNGQCVVDRLYLAKGVTLGNHCLIHPRVRIPSHTLVGTLTKVTQNTHCVDASVLLGLPARSMPFIQPSLTSDSHSTKTKFTVLKTVFLEIASNTIFALIVSTIQLGLMTNYSLIICIMLVFFCCILTCYLNQYYAQTKPGTYSFEETTNNWFHALIAKLTMNWTNVLQPFIGGTQWLIYLARGLGVRIKGFDVILSTLANITDYHLTTIGEHVRIHNEAILQCHTFEQRFYKLAPVTVGHSSIIKSKSFIFPGAVLEGANVIEPLTLIMKEEHLRQGTHWSGNPARLQFSAMS